MWSLLFSVLHSSFISFCILTFINVCHLCLFTLCLLNQIQSKSAGLLLLFLFSSLATQLSPLYHPTLLPAFSPSRSISFAYFLNFSCICVNSVHCILLNRLSYSLIPQNRMTLNTLMVSIPAWHLGDTRFKSWSGLASLTEMFYVQQVSVIAN